MIHVQDLKYRIQGFSLNISLIIKDAEYFVLLGMTGSGKTIFLENLCGLRVPAQGTIAINNKDMTKAEPRERGIGYVPQDGALFEHLNVAKNI
ncbi:MAG: ATP-binding cassette domain-containing protein, partial [bacterium]